MFSLNGIPTCAHKRLLTDILRNEWHFTGYVFSDEGAVENLQPGHHYADNVVDMAADCLNAGCNLELSSDIPFPAYLSIGNYFILRHTCKIVFRVGREEGNVLFNDSLITFYLRLYGVGHVVKDHSDSERGNQLPPLHGLLFFFFFFFD